MDDKLTFSERVLGWYEKHGRHHLPWQENKDPYRIWVSEIMLQQTQVNTVIPYFQNFMRELPDVQALASASEDKVLQLWAGLGYYSRARNLHKAAKSIVNDFDGQFPQSLSELEGLSGIGRSTAAAILSLAFDQKQAILDGNVKRVLARYHTVDGWSGKSSVLKELWQYAENHVPDQENAAYTQAMMDMGATLCTRSKPKCGICPLVDDCKAFKLDVVSEYPHPKPKKVLPEKQLVMLVLQNQQQEVLLFKRPSSGIWGGMWSLPEFDNQEQAEAWLEDHISRDDTPSYAASIDTTINPVRSSAVMKARGIPFELLPIIKHTFSHYHLFISPLLVKLNAHHEKQLTSQRVMEGQDQLWYNSNKEFSGGIPAPINVLLKRITT